LTDEWAERDVGVASEFKKLISKKNCALPTAKEEGIEMTWIMFLAAVPDESDTISEWV
jgi:hypothetical protein